MTASSCHEWWWCSGDVSAMSEDEQLLWAMTECSGDAGDVSAMSEDEQLQWAMTESIKSSTTAATSVISPSNSPYHSLCFALLLCSPVCLSVCLSVLLVQNSSKTTKKFFTFDVSTSIRGLHQKKLVLGLLLPVLGAIS